MDKSSSDAPLEKRIFNGLTNIRVAILYDHSGP